MKQLAEYIIKSLVDNPDKVELSEIESEKTTIIEVRVDEPDIGKVIGRQGRIIKAIRAILQASASKKGKRVVLEMLD
ncbi:TPA: RNA-binding protein [bacterium]|nr:RNA-binding protein [bacterium]